MAIQIQLRHDTAANWTSVNPILALGERGVETDTGKEKSGDGVTAWNSLSYFGGGGGSPTQSLTIVNTNAATYPLYILISPRNYAYNGVVTQSISTDKWVDSISYFDGRNTYLEFTDLKAVNGGVTINTPNVTSVNFPALTFCGGAIFFTLGTKLTTVQLPELLTCATFSISSSSTSISLSIPKLYLITGSYSLSFAYITSLNAPALVKINNHFNPSNCNSVTSISMPLLTAIGGNFAPSGIGSSAITTFNFSSLQTIGGNFSPASLKPNGTGNISFPAVTYIGGNFSPTVDTTTTFTFDVLTEITGTYNPTGSMTVNAPMLSTIGSNYNPNNMSISDTNNMGVLVSVGGYFNPSTISNLTNIQLTNLTSVGLLFTPSSITNLTTINLPAIINLCSNITSGSGVSLTSGLGSLANFTLGTTLKSVGGNFTITSAALNSTAVNNILVRLAALDGTNGTTAYSNKTITITGTSAAPSGAGLTAKTTLIARGCTVTTN